MAYLDKLKTDHAHAAKCADTIAYRIVMEGCQDAAADLHIWSLQRDSLDRQIAWMQRRTGWAWPIEPSWTD